MGSFAWKVAAIPALVGGVAVLAHTGNGFLTAGAVLAACLYGFAWERVFAVPDDEEDWPEIGPLSRTGPRSMAESMYVGAALIVLVLIVAVVIMLVQGHFLWAAATVGAAGVAALIARSLTRETRPPHRRRRRRPRSP